jgi:hypothetical protein
MRRFFQRRQNAAAINQDDLLEPSTATTTSSRKTFPSGIEPLYTPEDAVVEYVYHLPVNG